MPTGTLPVYHLSLHNQRVASELEEGCGLALVRALADISKMLASMLSAVMVYSRPGNVRADMPQCSSHPILLASTAGQATAS